MLEDDQRFEELESKLAALSSQVESLELDTELDPFSEDDVRRTVEYFKSLELAGLESEDEGFEDDESSSSDDFISVQTTGGPSFKTHWIAPASCENMTRDLARDAFVQGAADRYGTSQQVNNGDVLILLCREAAGEEPEEGSEPAEPEAPKEICRYIGLAYNTLVHPASAEPTSETEELISAPVGNYEIFVWSSCECSGEPAETVVLPSIFEASSESSTNGNYASIGDAASPDMSNADGLLTDASLRKSQDTSSSNLAKGLSNTLEKTDAGYKAQLVQLSQELSRYHLDQKKKQLNFKADKKNLNTHDFGSDLFVSKNLELSNGECGNLETVSIAGETFDLALLKEGAGAHDSTFLTTAKISLGTAASIGGTFNLDVYDTNADALENSLLLASGSTVFLPTVTDANAELIEPSVTISSLVADFDVTIDAFYAVIYETNEEGDAEYWVYQKKDVIDGLTWASGLLLGSGNAAEDAGEPELVGIIRVAAIPLTYGCHPEYGCQPDPAGEFFDSSCGSGCPPPSELMLRYRPKNIWRYNEVSGSSGTCYEELAHHELNPAQSTKTTQGYTNGGEFRAELVGGEQVDNFYANGVLIPFDDLYFAELPAEQLCYELTFRPSSVEVYFKAHDPSQPDNFCLRLVSEHLKEPGDTTDQTQAYTNSGEMREVVSVGAGGVVTTKPIFYVDNIPRNPDAAGSSWVLGFEGVVPTVAAICSEVSEINYSAAGGQNTFSDTVSYAETQSPTKVSVSLQYNDINNAAGSSYRFVDSSGTQLDPLESYVYAEGNDPLLFTLEIPQGSTGLNIYMNDQGSAGSSAWDINLTAQ